MSHWANPAGFCGRAAAKSKSDLRRPTHLMATGRGSCEQC